MNVEWAGWYQEGTSDKLWGVLRVENTFYNFWCRRGARLQFKRNDDLRFYHKITREKLKKGYVEISTSRLVEIYPGFFEEAESNLVFNLMAGKVR